MRYLFALAALLPCLAQDAPPFHVDVRLVNVGFTVRDARGALVTNLAKDDFEVLDDGSPQTITYLAHSADLPLTLGLIEDFSGSQDKFIKRHRRDLERFLKRELTPRDRAFLIGFGNHIRLASDLTSSTPQLMEAIERFNHKPGQFPEIGPPELRELGTAFYDALYYATTLKLAPAEGVRKALLVFSDGEDNSSAHHMLDAIECAQSENVMIFSVRYTEPRKGKLTARNKYGMRVMERISRDTGGADFDAEKQNLSKSFEQIGEELRSAYELGYHSNHPGSDGTFHKLVVRAKRPGLVIRTKAGYFDGSQPRT